MATNVGNLEARLELKAAQFISEMKRVSKQTKKTQNSMKGMQRIGANAFRFLAGGALIAGAKRITQAAESLDRMSDRLGVNARELQAWQLIGERFDVTGSALTVGIQRLTRRAAEAAQGMGEAKDALRELRIDAKKLTELSLDEQIFALGKAFEGVKSNADRVRLAFKLFDTEGVGFLQFLNEGEAGLRKIRQGLDGALWSDTQRRKLKEMNEQLTEANQTLSLLFGNLLAVAGAGIGGILKSASDGLTKIVRVFVANFSDDPALQQIIADKMGVGKRPPKPPPADITIGGGKLATFETQLGQDQAALAIRQLEAMTTESIAKREEQEIAMIARIGKAEVDALRKRNAQQDMFINLFTSNMVQAADGAFGSILKSWIRTLQQMAARAVATKLLGSFAKTGIGKALGFQHGGIVPGNPGDSSLAVVHGGERISRPGQAGKAGGVTVNAPLTVNGASRSEFAAAAALLEDRIKASVFDELTRAGR